MRRSPLLRATAVLALASLAACRTVGPNFTRPESPTATGYAQPDANQETPGASAPGKGPVAQFGAGPGLHWWEAFGSDELNGYVTRALAGNQSLAASRATLAKARERIRAVAGRQLPQVDAQARAEHEQVNLNAYGFNSSTFGIDVGNPEFDLYTVGGGVSYDLDLFGGLRRAKEQAVADAETGLYDTEAAHLTIAGRVVLQVLTIAALNERIATHYALLAEDQRNLDLTRARQRGGEGTLVEVLSAQSQLTADQANLPDLEQQRAEARNMLAVLLGIGPAELGATDFTLAALHLPDTVPVTLPSEVIHKRPDILASEAKLHSAVAAVGMAEARLYPDITLGATVAQAAGSLPGIFRGSGSGFDVFAGLTAPIFHGGTLKAEKRGAEDEARAATARYRQTVLEAFGQISDLLAALDNDQRSVTVRKQAKDVADSSLHLSRRSFQVGNSGILQVLDASRTAQQAQIGLVDAHARQFLNVARLYVATAGGWTEPVKDK